jgi:hypothetical protein
MDDKQDAQEFDLAEGIHIRVLDAGLVIVVECQTIQREAIDKLINWLKDRFSGWDAETPWLALYDLSLPGAMVTPYMRAKTAEVNQLRADVGGRVAMVVRRDTTGNLLNMFTQLRPQDQRPLRVWFNRDDALAWLRELL